MIGARGRRGAGPGLLHQPQPSLEITTLGFASPSDWAYARVGQYLQEWALAEMALDDAMASALSLSPLQGLIVAADMFVNNKLKICLAAVQASAIPKPEQRKYVKALNTFLGLTGDRNMVAHRLFFAEDDSVAVAFYVSQLKSTLDSRRVVWTEDDFKRRYRQLSGIYKRLKELPPRIKGLRLAKLLANLPPQPTQGVAGLLALGLSALGNPPPSEHHSGDPEDATPQRFPETPSALGE